MNIKKTALWMTVLYTLFFIVLIVIATNIVIFASFRKLEENIIEKKFKAIGQINNINHDEIEKIVVDWAHNECISNGISVPASSETQMRQMAPLFQHSRINFAIVLNQDLQPVMALKSETGSAQVRDIKAEIPPRISAAIRQFRGVQPRESRQFRLKTEWGPALLAVSTIQDAATQQIKGYLMMGRYIDVDDLNIKALAEDEQLIVHDLSRPVSAELSEKIRRFESGERIRFLPQNRVCISSLTRDINDEELIFVQYLAPTDTFGIVLHTRDIILAVYVIISIFKLFLLHTILNKRYLKRLSKIISEMDEITHNPESLAWIGVDGKDELAVLATEMNEMLAAMRGVKKELKLAKVQAEESNRLKSSFLATITHELRTPLNHILGFGQLIEHQVKDAELKEFAQQIQKSGNNLLSIFEDILDLVFAENKVLKAKPEPVSCAALFAKNQSRLEEILKTSGKNRQIKLIFSPVLDCPEDILSLDAVRVSQILNKLFLNAVKYTESGSIEFGSQRQENRLRYFVSDTGIGISKEDQKLIFEYFRQADEGNTRHYQGVGIGLAIAKKIADLIGAQISVESRPGRGSSFFLDIPLDAASRNIS